MDGGASGRTPFHSGETHISIVVGGRGGGTCEPGAGLESLASPGGGGTTGLSCLRTPGGPARWTLPERSRDSLPWDAQLPGFSGLMSLVKEEKQIQHLS